MCIVGCAPKSRLTEDLYRFHELSYDSSYHVIRIDVPKKLWNATKEQMFPLIKDVSLTMNTHLYQGCVVYAEGTTEDPKKYDDILTHINFSIYHGRPDLISESYFMGPSLRPTEKNDLKKGEENIKITLNFVFSHNSKIKGYFYQRDDWIHIFSPSFTRKFTKNYKKLKQHDLIDGVNVHFLQDKEDITNDFIKSLKNKPTAILCRDNEVVEALEKPLSKTKHEFVYADEVY